MGTGQIPRPHQELFDDFLARKDKRLTEDLNPISQDLFALRIQPGRERTMGLAKRLKAAGIFDCRFNLAPIADDAGVLHEPSNIARTETRHPVNVETPIGFLKSLAFLQNRQPGKACLIDLEAKTFEKFRIIPRRETMLLIVKGAMNRMVLCNLAIAGGHLYPSSRKEIRSDSTKK